MPLAINERRSTAKRGLAWSNKRPALAVRTHTGVCVIGGMTTRCTTRTFPLFSALTLAGFSSQRSFRSSSYEMGRAEFRIGVGLLCRMQTFLFFGSIAVTYRSMNVVPRIHSAARPRTTNMRIRICKSPTRRYTGMEPKIFSGLREASRTLIVSRWRRDNHFGGSNFSLRRHGPAPVSKIARVTR